MVMDFRKRKILSCVVQSFINNACPVSSAMIQAETDLSCSTATIRNELNWLEREGFVFHPYTSSGKVPTDEGYRFFVNNLMELWSQSRIKARFVKYGRRYPLASVKNIGMFLSRETGTLVTVIDFTAKRIWRSGLRNALKEPEFTDKDSIFNFWRNSDRLLENLSEFVKIVSANTTRVYIGREVPNFIKSGDFALIALLVSDASKRILLSMFGPKRMNYAKNISFMEFVKELLRNNDESL